MQTQTRPGRRMGAGRTALLLLFVLLWALWISGARGETAPLALNVSGVPIRTPAVDPALTDEGYSAVLYDNTDGLPTSEANAITQTGDGFIWIGSYAGLIRYDGRSFEQLRAQDGITNVRCLYVDSRDRLWIGTNDAGLFLQERGELTRWTKEDGLGSMSIRCLTEGADGLIYVANSRGVGTVDASLRYSPAAEAVLGGQLVYEIHRGADGLVYGVTGAGDLFTLRGGELVDLLPREAWPYEAAESVLPDPLRPGMLYAGGDNRVFHGRLGEQPEQWEQIDITPLSGVLSMEVIDGRLWVCTQTGVGPVVDGALRVLNHIPMKNAVESVMTDSEGNLWLASARQGVLKIVPNRFTDLFAEYALPAGVVNGTCAAHGRLYIGGEDGLTAVEDGEVLDSLPITAARTAAGDPLGTGDLMDFLSGCRIRSLFADSRGSLWISTARGVGLLRYDRDGALTQYRVEDGLLSETVRFVTEREDGTLLVGTQNGINVIRDGALAESYGEAQGLPVRLILTIAEGSAGEIIAGSDGGGLYIIDDSGLRILGLADGLTSETIMRVRRARSGDRWWIVTSNSLACLMPDGQIRTIWDFGGANNFDLYENSRGDLWVMGSGGIDVLTADSVAGRVPVEPVHFGISDGLPYVDTANSYSELTPEGVLYMAGNKGVVKMDLEAPLESAGQPRITVPWIDADGVKVYPDAGGRFTLPGFTRKVTIYPYVLSYALVNPQVACRLEGFDREDVVSTRSRLTPLHYTNLSNGTYYFLVSVHNPVLRTEQTADFEIIKGKASSVGNAGSVVMDVTSLFYMAGLLIYTALYRKRGRLDDRLFLAMILLNMTLAVADAITYLVDGSGLPFTRPVMIAGNLVFYGAFEIFPYLYMLYLDFRAYMDKARLRRLKLWAALPCLAILLLLAVNLFTGWFYSVDAEGIYRPGPWEGLVFVPVGLYMLAGMLLAGKINRRLVLLGLVLVGVRLIWALWFRDISSTALIYTLFLVCTHIHVMNRPLVEEAP